jgi:hypothetical protein
MNAAHDSLRDKLLQAESYNPTLQQKYEKEVIKIMEKNLNLMQKISCSITAVFTLCAAGFFGYYAITAPEGFPGLARAEFAFGAVMGLVWTVMMAVILKRGKLNLRSASRNQAGWAWVFVVVLMTLTLLITGNHPNMVLSVYMVVTTLVFFIGGAVFLLADKIYQSELNTKEQLLKLELQMAELQEVITKQSKNG